VVYIKEAHALDSRSPMSVEEGMPLIQDAVTQEERNATAAVCMTKLALEPIPSLVDDMDNTANDGYSGWPDRLYLVGKDGKVAYHGFEGPFGFKPDELEDAILAELAVE
jgi:hypothetical protein